MKCEESQSHLNAYCDGELDLTDTLELEEHLRDCATCSLAYDQFGSLQTGLRGESLRFQPTAAFESRLRKTLRDEAGTRPQKLNWRWLVPALSAAGLLIAFSFFFIARSPGDDAVAREIVSSHVRSLMATNHLIDVPSQNPHTVKPWFDGKLDFSPPVKDFAEQDFTLVGGRLDYIENRPVAALIYQRRKHQINVFIWPTASGDSRPVVHEQQGYNLIHWIKSGMTYWAISDLNAAELQQLQEELEKQ
jgi:anti-sigma factor RsiW